MAEGIDQGTCLACGLQQVSHSLQFCDVHLKQWLGSQFRANVDWLSEESYEAAVHSFIERTRNVKESELQEV